MKNGLITDSVGTQFWYKDDLVHRDDDLPAIIYSDGSQFWWKDDTYHRENGPAFMWADGDISWYLNNKLYSFDEWCLELDKSPKEKAFLALKYL